MRLVTVKITPARKSSRSRARVHTGEQRDAAASPLRLHHGARSIPRTPGSHLREIGT